MARSWRRAESLVCTSIWAESSRPPDCPRGSVCERQLSRTSAHQRVRGWPFGWTASARSATEPGGRRVGVRGLATRLARRGVGAQFVLARSESSPGALGRALCVPNSLGLPADRRRRGAGSPSRTSGQSACHRRGPFSVRVRFFAVGCSSSWISPVSRLTRLKRPSFSAASIRVAALG